MVETLAVLLPTCNPNALPKQTPPPTSYHIRT
jgi:hypothetical protein